MMFLVECSDPNLAQLIYFLKGILNLIKILIPIALIIFGSVDLGKAVMAGKDDEIKKAQATLLKRAVAAIAVFFLASIVSLVFGLLPEGIQPDNCFKTVTQ